MRAVNLVPPEARAGRVSPGKSGGAVYGVIGALVVALLMLSSLAVVKRDQKSAEQEFAAIQQSTQAYEQVATQYAQFETASKQANERIELVRSLAQARFDWAGTLRDLSRLIPAQTQIQSLDASVKDGEGPAGASQLRTQLASVPAITLKGCSRSQGTVAELVTRLQAMRRVTSVTLEQSETDAKVMDFNKDIVPLNADGTAAEKKDDEDAELDGDCSLQKPYYGFTVTVFYAPGGAQASSEAVAPPAGAGTPQIGTEPAGATQPATPAGN